ncbi:ABC transporter permease [Thermobifida halotolerans]|uniref:ABC transporter permease n=1 Tax=Thermobifida halotolerans TaxID=483545 RepID=A0A399G408_9ACTN|nr:ABC transporter permease [Thermobifida halotolerans]UOE17948.1 ABC transporter permease [Thermobifida halotolerans]
MTTLTEPVRSGPAAPRPDPPGDGATRRAPSYWSLAGAPGLVFVVLAFAVPLAAVVVKSLTDPSPANYTEALGSQIFRGSVWTTLRMAVVVTVLCALAGYPFAYVLARVGRTMRSLLFVSLMLSFWTSLLVRSYAWQVILNDTGVVNTLLLDLGLAEEPLTLIRTPLAVYVGMVHILVPYLILAVYAQLRSLDPDLERAAQGLGAPPWKVFWRVTLPLSLPGVAAGSVLVFVLALGFYVTPQLLGGAQDVYLGQAIVMQIEQFLDTGVGSAMAVMLFVAVLAVLGIVARFVGVGRVLGLGQGGGRS